MDPKQLKETSKFLSFVLRHQPDSIGLTLDNEGWADIDALIAGAARRRRQLDLPLIQTVVDTNDKKRFSLSADGRRIRAVQGHTTDSVNLSHIEKTPPDLLFHGTATRSLESIRQQGLIPGSRHHVHLSQDVATATAVGRRYGKPVVLTVEALRMQAQGFKFFQAENGVWLTDQVPAAFLRED